MASGDKAVVKVILETCLLPKEESKSVCMICMEAGAGFVKTSTGFSTQGAATVNIRENLRPRITSLMKIL